MMEESERVAVHKAVVTSVEATARLERALADVELHRRLARKFADQARGLLASMRDRPAPAHSSPSVVTRVEALVNDLSATASGVERREAEDRSGPREAVAYSPPAPPEELAQAAIRPHSKPPPVPPSHPADHPADDELRVPTLVGSPTPPPADDPTDEELRVPTVVGSSRRPSQVRRGAALDAGEVELDDAGIDER